ncbi:hypothetical protein FRX31_035081 [Thalictrum thalictroides]|uniref:Uncharacterized protein n=1 Tax=Thalictrum thalictroides TaxID=46969 RepID=A0A7J6US27_THATH|nr:hypothetical protein FRX31_035081 [Thalictrum thalictroides]
MGTITIGGPKSFFAKGCKELDYLLKCDSKHQQSGLESYKLLVGLARHDKRGADMKKNYNFHIWLQTGSERNNGGQVVATGQSRNQGDGTLKHSGAGTDQQQEMAAMQHKGRRSQQQQGPARFLKISPINERSCDFH